MDFDHDECPLLYTLHFLATKNTAQQQPREPREGLASQQLRPVSERARVDSGIVHLQLVLTYFHWDLGIADSESEEAPRRDHP